MRGARPSAACSLRAQKVNREKKFRSSLPYKEKIAHVKFHHHGSRGSGDIRGDIRTEKIVPYFDSFTMYTFK